MFDDGPTVEDAKVSPLVDVYEFVLSRIFRPVDRRVLYHVVGGRKRRRRPFEGRDRFSSFSFGVLAFRLPPPPRRRFRYRFRYRFFALSGEGGARVEGVWVEACRKWAAV